MVTEQINEAYIYPNQDVIADTLDVRIIEINPMPSSRCTQAPATNGLNINDNKVRNPIKVKVRCSLVIDKGGEYRETLRKINSMQESQDTIFSSVLSHTDYYRNLTLIESPHRENVDSFDVYEFDLMFQEIILVGESPKVLYDELSPTVHLGNIA